MAQVAFDVSGANLITHNVWVEVPDLDTDRDGINDRIRIQIRRPAATNNGVKLPIVMTASPYSGGTKPFPQHDITGQLYEPTAVDADGLDLRVPPTPVPTPPAGTNPPYDGTGMAINTLSASAYQSYFLPRGFIFVEAQNLGTGHSTGCPTIGGVEESLAMKAVIEWFNGRGTGRDINGNLVDAYWTTGNTAMIGVSYDGTLPLAAASTGVEGLKAIVPIAGVSSYYDHRRSFGAVINSNPTIGTDADTLFDNILSRAQPQVCGYMRQQIDVLKERTTGDWTAWWEERDYTRYVGNFRAAVLISHGLNDLNTKPRMFARLWDALTLHNVPRKIWLNTGGHGDGANSGTRQAAWRDELNRFWSQYLFGQANNWTGGPRAAVQRATNTWTDYDDWPVPGSTPTAFSMVPSGNNTIGSLNVGHPDADPLLELIVDNSAIDANNLVRAAASPHRLVYKSPLLTAPVHVSGVPSVKLKMSFAQPSAIVSAMLVHYPATGQATILTRGWADPQNRYSISQTHAVVPGTPYDIEFTLQPQDFVFPAGSRIGLVVMSSDQLFTLRPPAGRELTLDPAASSFTLPIVGGEAAFVAASVAAPPAPADLVAAALAGGSVGLSWNDQSATETGFRIERALDGASFVSVATVGADVTTFTDTASLPPATRSYRVRAFNTGGGDSGFSNIVTIAAPAIGNGPAAGGAYGEPFELAIAATYAPTSYEATGLPGGLAVDALTGVISGVPTEAGTFAATLSASNGLGTGTATVTFTIAPALPTLAWNGPVAINYGTQLSDLQLNASTGVAGSFSYAPAAGTLLPPGVHTLTVTFAPDSANYAGATASVSIEVIAVPPAVTVPAPITEEATGSGGAVVSFAATASDVVDSGLTATCAPSSGTLFALGETTVTCSATSSVGTVGSSSFTVTVRDTTPPALTLPAPIFVEAGSNGLAAIPFTATALDRVDGAVGVTCTPGPGSSFAMGLTTVNCSSTDARGNAASGSFTVNVSNPLGRYVAFSREQTWLRDRTTVLTGDVGANRSQPGPWHRRDRDDDGDRDDTVEVRIGERVRMMQPGSRVVGDTIWLRDKSSVHDVVYNELIDRSRSNAVLGDRTSPAPLPMLLMPTLPAIAPGSQDVRVNRNATVVLPPGRYRNVRVQSRGKLVLSGGLYQIESLEIDAQGTVRAQAATELRIKEELVTDSDASIVVANVSGLTARHFVIHVEGADDRCRHDGRFGRRHDDDDDAGQTVVHIGSDSVIQANISAPNGTLWLKSDTTATGSFVGRRVRVGRNVTLTLDSAFQ